MIEITVHRIPSGHSKEMRNGMTMMANGDDDDDDDGNDGDDYDDDEDDDVRPLGK